MTAERLQRLVERLVEVGNTDELLDLEILHGPFDEDDLLAARALFQIAAIRCHLARGPAPSPDSFTLIRPAPAQARERFEVRGRLGTRIVRVGWADGMLFGSLYAIACIACDDACLAHAATARAHIIERLHVVFEEGRTLAA
jgi:hypothetical protein